MRVFIVGATGVIGRDLLPLLTARGDEVVALVRSLERAEAIAGPNVTLVEGDLLQVDEGQLATLLEGCDAAAHLATALRAGSPGLGATNTSAALRTDGTAKLLRAAEAAGVEHYIQQSIAFAYVDGGEDWIDESWPLLRDEDGSPRLIEQMEALVNDSPIASTILRGGIFVGTDTFQERTATGLRAGTERYPGDGQNWVPFVHVTDYAHAVAAALRQPHERLTLNITAEPMRNRAYLDHLSELLGTAPATPNPDAPPPRSYRTSNTAAREAIGWSPTHAIWPVVAT